MMKSINAKIENLSPFNYKLLLVILNVFFAILACVGQVGQNVSLPLWAGAVSSNCSYYRNNSMEEIMDSYFILSFASFSFILIFGLCTLVVMIFNFNSIKRSISFPQWQLLLIGVSDAFNGILVVFSAMPFRTAPFLQAILGNITIPLTIVLRLLILRKKPTLLKLIAAGIVVVGLILSLIPTIGGFDKDNSNSDWLQQSTASRILWPFCFMIGFVPAVLMNVFEEKSLKDTRNVNMFYLLFCTSIYQFLTVANFFYLDIVPGFGFASSLEEFGANYWFAIKCFFGQATCDSIPGIRATTFIFMYVMSYIGSGLLLRYTEGATYLAIVQSLVTPLGALFWSLFNTDHCGGFFWEPHADSLTYFSIGGIILIVPAILLYNVNLGIKDFIQVILNMIDRLFGMKMEKRYKKNEEITPLLN